MNKKKKILLLSDDMRLHSGVGTVSLELILGTVHQYDWVQIGGALKHPDNGKLFDMSEQISKLTDVTDASVKIYSTDGYGNPDLLRHIIGIEKPDAVMIFTDPRFWDWLFNMEHEIRQNIPLIYLNIWDDLPVPHWNRNAYESCDLLMAISKQTYNINKMVLGHGYYNSLLPDVDATRLSLSTNTGLEQPYRTKPLITYVPHGINHNKYYPLDALDNDLIKVKQSLFGDVDPDFVVFYNSRNIRRKCPSNLILAYKIFVDSLSEEKRNGCYLLMHTDPVDPNGTDLPAVAEALAPGCNIIISNRKVSPEQLNCMYNIADVTCNPSSAEGFGLSHMESIMAGTPTIATVVGGLQDQMGFKVNGEYLKLADFDDIKGSNSTKLLSSDCGDWTFPIWPTLNLQGSPATPYIYDSVAPINAIVTGLKQWYHSGNKHREDCGLAGRNWAIENNFSRDAMANYFIESVEICFDQFTPKPKFNVIDVNSVTEPQYANCVLL